MSKSELEAEFLALYGSMQRLHNIELSWPEREHVFAPPRRWRFDFAWPELKLAIEIDGGIWSGGRHTNGAALVKQYDKQNAAAIRGWRVLRLTDRHLRDQHACFDLLLMAMGALEVE